MSDVTELPDLLAERLGGAALHANDEFFAPKESLTKPGPAEFLEHAYTERGKLMDGWESRRKRGPGHDWCVLRLGLPGRIRKLVVDTSFFRGNFPESCSVEGTSVTGNVAPESLVAPDVRWDEVLPRSALQGDARNAFEVRSPWSYSHLRLNIFPDGGVARLRVHGEPTPDWKRLRAARDAVDLAAIENGGIVLATSDRFFGPGHNLLLPGLGTHMGDGWETRRRRGPGHDWALVRLGVAGSIRRVVIETTHFKGNYPDRFALDVCDAGSAGEEALTRPEAAALWTEVLAPQKLEAHARHEYEAELAPVEHATHARLRIFPDGGVSRLRLFGHPSAEGRARAGMTWFDTLVPGRAETELLACCAAPRFARELAARRPFASFSALAAAADRAVAELDHDGISAAIRAHPRLGERSAGTPDERRWSATEQSGASGADADVRSELARLNRAYEARFGWTFLLCATGKSGAEMLAALRSRLAHDAEAEWRIAAGELGKITRLRLQKLVGLDG